MKFTDDQIVEFITYLENEYKWIILEPDYYTCPDCDREFETDYIFCPYCGKKSEYNILNNSSFDQVKNAFIKVFGKDNE
jgi:predicted amidophosphoribosyltransferase